MKKIFILSLLIITLISLSGLSLAAENDDLEGYMGFDINSRNRGLGFVAGGRSWLSEWQNIKLGAGSEVEYISYTDTEANKVNNAFGLIAKANFDITGPINEAFDYPDLIVDNNWTIKSYLGAGIYFTDVNDGFSPKPGMKLGNNISFPISEIVDFRTGVGVRYLDDFDSLFINASLMSRF